MYPVSAPITSHQHRVCARTARWRRYRPGGGRPLPACRRDALPPGHMGSSAAPHLSLLLLSALLLLVPVACAAAGGRRHHSRLLVPLCADVLRQLQPEQVHELRDTVQLLQQHRRQLHELQSTADGAAAAAKQQPQPQRLQKKQRWRTAAAGGGSTDATAGQGASLSGGNTDLERRVEQLASNFTSQVAGLMPNVTTALPAGQLERLLARCVVGHLNPRLYDHHQPQYSFMLEYFKRPWAIRNITRALEASCADAGMACELLINGGVALGGAGGEGRGSW